jgi:magnesium-transporting ATPase (P-type)
MPSTGITTVMISGDYPTTAHATARGNREMAASDREVALVIASSEERIIARHCVALLGAVPDRIPSLIADRTFPC